MGTGSFPGVKRPGRGADHPPASKYRGHERVELYLYSPSGPSWLVIGRTQPGRYVQIFLRKLLLPLSGYKNLLSWREKWPVFLKCWYLSTELCSVKAKKIVTSNCFQLITGSPKIKAVLIFFPCDIKPQPIYWKKMFIFLNFQNYRAAGQDLGIWPLLNISNSIFENKFFSTGYPSDFVMEKYLNDVFCYDIKHIRN